VVHPVQSVIESLYAAGRCPRLHVNAMFEGVVCPDFIREQWRERLIIDLDPSYPLELKFQPEALAADLSFGGYVTRCTFPYGAVYVVADRSTGRGIVLDQNMPESVRKQRTAKAAPTAAAASPPKPSLHSVAGEVAPDRAVEAAEAADPETDTEQVQKRRAAFKVIDGGG
jgi:stringent starvation protein B